MIVQSTSQTLPVERFEADLQTVCGRFDIRSGPEQNIAWGGAQGAVRADIELAMIATNLQQILRTSKNIKQDHGENYFLIMQQDGRALMAQNETATMMLPGDMIIVDSSKPSEFTFFGDRSTQVSLHFPRTEIQERFGTDIQGGLSMSHCDPTAKAIKAVINKALSVERDAPQSSFLREALLGLLGVFLFDQIKGLSDQRTNDVNDGAPLLARALQIIESGFQHYAFSAKSIADTLQVHPRQIQRAFECLGVTPTKYLMAKRLEYACGRLQMRQPGQTDVLISDIAYESGFSDLSYFNRCFRQAFGCTPGEFSATNTSGF